MREYNDYTTVEIYLITEQAGPDPGSLQSTSITCALCSVCSCSFRYTLDHLFPMMNAVKERAELYDDWASLVTQTLEAKLEKKKGKQHEQMRKQSGKAPDKPIIPITKTV